MDNFSNRPRHGQWTWTLDLTPQFFRVGKLSSEAFKVEKDEQSPSYASTREVGKLNADSLFTKTQVQENIKGVQGRGCKGYPGSRSYPKLLPNEGGGRYPYLRS